ncbi:MAG: dipeptidase [Hyphomonas sp.]
MQFEAVWGNTGLFDAVLVQSGTVRLVRAVRSALVGYMEIWEALMRRQILACGLAVVLAACSGTATVEGDQAVPVSEPVTAPVEESLHDRLLVLDTHLDTPALFHTPEYNFLQAGTWETDGTHVDLPRMKEGGLDGGFWVIFTRQGPLTESAYQATRNQALMRQTAIREFAAKYSDEVELAFKADDAARIAGEGKRVVYQSMENSYPLGEDLSLLETFYIGGLRMIAPVHFANNQFADSATDIEPDFDGLSAAGEALVREANRLGLVLDGSHASDATLRDMMALSTTPVILSHTGVKGVFDHPRNIDDALLLELKANGGVIQMNIFGTYLEKLVPSDERSAAIAELDAEFGTDTSAMTEDELKAWQEKRRQIGKMYPAPRSTYEKFKEHLFHALEVVGPEHVGISGDWDGGGGVDGMSDIRFLPKITADLLEAGYTEADIEKIWSGNLLRLMRAAEAERTSKLSSPDVLN